MLTDMKRSGIIAVIRGISQEQVVDLGKALAIGGVKFMEITVETPKAMSVIEKASDTFKNELIIGAGTVLDPETARLAILAGAEYIVSPTFNEETIKITKRYGKVSIPGAMTPTEILKAYELGADAVKVFPSQGLGPNYVKDLKGPLPHIPLIATGGIDLKNIAEYFKAGVIAVGVGGALINKKMINSGRYEEITTLSKKYVNLIKNIREH